MPLDALSLLCLLLSLALSAWSYVHVESAARQRDRLATLLRQTQHQLQQDREQHSVRLSLLSDLHRWLSLRGAIEDRDRRDMAALLDDLLGAPTPRAEDTPLSSSRVPAFRRRTHLT